MVNKQWDALTLGEVMMRFSPPVGERLQRSAVLQRGAAGAEMNVAVGLAQLGLRAAACTKVPDNALGRFVVEQMRASGVSDEAVVYDSQPEARLGVYYFEGAAAPRKPSVVYDRKRSSFCTLTMDELPQELPASARLMHTTGITLGLGEGPRAAATALMRAFKEAGGRLSFDINFRANLWTDQEERAAVEPLLPLVDILFISEESLRRMFSRTGELREMVRAFAAQYGISTIISTQREAPTPTHHRFTSLCYDAAEDSFYTEAPYEIDVVDRVGSGDAFVAGALSALLRGEGAQRAVSVGNACAAAKCTVSGDLPCMTRQEIDKLVKLHSQTGPQSEMDR